MLKRTLILLAVALSQWGCDIDYGENLYPLELWNLEGVRSRLEREKRDFLKIEAPEIGKGPIVAYFGFLGLFPEHLQDRFMLDFINQHGIELGLNGMAVSGKRRITIDPELVCEVNDAGCYLLRPKRQFVNEIGISKKALVVEATLTESCAPVRFRWRASGGFLTLVDVSAGCRTKAEPKIGGSDWHVY